jgi:Abortive infection alpha
MSEPPERTDDGPEGVEALSALARVAAITGWRTSGWALRTSLRASRRMMEATVSPPKALELAREITRELSALTDNDRRADAAEHSSDASAGTAHSLRDEGELLLRRSRDVRLEFDAHPAYERILSELAPDEARILRLLLLDGPQPAVDIRTGGPLGLVRSRLIAPGLSMIGARAGCRYVERVPSYLNNLFRLGLVWFSRETLRDPLRYQVLEAQPEVLQAIHSVAHAKVVRRSIHLTPFGEDFCRMALFPEESGPASLPEHSVPPTRSLTPQPPTEVSDR